MSVRVLGAVVRVWRVPLLGAMSLALVFVVTSAAPAATPGTLSVRLGGSAAMGTANLPNFSTLVFGMNQHKYLAGHQEQEPGHAGARLQVGDRHAGRLRHLRRRGSCAAPASPTRRHSPTTPPTQATPGSCATRAANR